MLVCPHYTITFYPSAYPAATGALVLLSRDHLIEAGSLLGSQVEQMIQRADYLRGTTPDFWVRGSRATSLDWTEVRQFATPSGATAAALAAAASMPAASGWMQIAVPDEGRAWAVTPAAVRAGGSRSSKVGGLIHLHLSWSVDAGAITEIATEAEDDALLTEIGTELLTEDGYYLALETLT